MRPYKREPSARNLNVGRHGCNVPEVNGNVASSLSFGFRFCLSPFPPPTPLPDTYTLLINSIMGQLMKILSVPVFKQSPIVLADIIGRHVLRRCVVIMAPGFACAIMPPVIIKWELSSTRTLMWWRVLSRGSRIMLKVLFRVSYCET